MTKTEVLLYGALLESDMYEDGYGSTDDDAKLLRSALQKIYGISEDASDEVKENAESVMQNDMKSLVMELREKVANFISE